MDRDGDGVITRAEWRGGAQSFDRHDWNGDGVLSGDEVRPGAYRPSRELPDFDDQNTEFTDWTSARFDELDHNRDGRLSREEWHYDLETFYRVDRNRDGVLSRSEFLGSDNTAADDDDRNDRFDYLDSNNDNRISRDEWHGGDNAFRALDRNGDNMLSRAEVMGEQQPVTQGTDWFRSLDVDRNGRITPDEWHWARAGFDRRDVNKDGAITRDELGLAPGQRTSHNEAYDQGHARGLTDGRQAGREDKQRANRWDLEGQRELEQADAGYRTELGPRVDYQSGYRIGFRAGYREGFGPNPNTR